MSIKKEAIPAKLCYTHIGGKLGILLMETFINKGWLAKKSVTSKNFYVTEKGKKEFIKLGLDLSQIELDEVA
jgi:hypothetical protein